STKPHHDGAGGPLTPAERMRQAAGRGAASEGATATDQLIDEHILRMMKGLGPATPPRPRPRQTAAERSLEEHWYECLLFPLRVAWLWLVLTIFLACISITLAEFLPRQLAEETIPPGAVVFSCVWGLL